MKSIPLSPAAFHPRAALPQVGFSLAELMVTMAILSSVLGMGVPNYSVLLQNHRDEAAQMDLLSSLAFARSEAVKRGVPVMLTPSAPGVVGNELGGGWSVWVDSNGDGVRDVNAETLRVHAAFSGGLRMSFPAPQMSFQPSGYSGFRDDNGNLAAASFTVCDNRHNVAGGQVSVLPSGATVLNPAYICS